MIITSETVADNLTTMKNGWLRLTGGVYLLFHNGKVIRHLIERFDLVEERTVRTCHRNWGCVDGCAQKFYDRSLNLFETVEDAINFTRSRGREDRQATPL